MADQNLLQFAAHFVALGCTLDFDSKSVTMSVTGGVVRHRGIVDAALKDIEKYEDTKNYIDGATQLLLPETVDGKPNPLPKSLREHILEELGIKNRGLFVRQELVLSLNNHAWHISEKPSTCTYFGRACVNRGIEPDPERKGKISHRKPEEFHTLDAKKRIKREQLVSPALKELFSKIPAGAFTSARSSYEIALNLREYSKLSVEQQLEVLEKMGVR